MHPWCFFTFLFHSLHYYVCIHPYYVACPFHVASHQSSCWTVLLHHIFPQVVHRSFVNPLCSCYSTKPEPTFSCCCSVDATVSRYRLRHACVTQALRTFLFSFFKMFLSNMTPSIFPQAFAPCCIRHRISTSECSSSLTIPPSYTKPSTWLNFLSTKLMFKSSLWCQTHISSVFFRLIIGPCFLNTPFHSSNNSCSSCFLSAIMARSFAYIPFLRISFMLIFLLISATTMIKFKGTFPCL